VPVAVPDFERGDLKGLRIGIARAFDGEALHPQVAAALAASRKLLAGLGAELLEVDVPNFDRLSDLGSLIVGSESAALHWDWVRSRPQDYGEQVLRRLQPGFASPGVLYLRALQQRAELLAEALSTTFAACDVLHTPVIRVPVPKAEDYERDVAADLFGAISRFTACTRPINFLGLPALSVPTGFDGAGLPTAMQLVGRPFAEATLLTVGHLYEQAVGPPGTPTQTLADRDKDA
jgi:aspartyl-tRNA(Asn)/glutamyl-tRNA(Gln) amidotransferase subunit A